jgi:hypothetical protein
VAYGKIKTFVRQRLYRDVGRRSQGPFRPPEGKTHTQQFLQMGLQLLALARECLRLPAAGNCL